MSVVCDLADDLRDAIIEYQVSAKIKYLHTGLCLHTVYRLHSRRQSTSRTVD